MNLGSLFEQVRPVDQTNEEYHSSSIESISRSRLKVFKDSPEKFEGQFITGEIVRKETAALRFGKVSHEVILECDGVVDESNWSGQTLGIFRPAAAPRRDPDVTNGIEEIWVVNLPEPGLVRRSMVWGDLRGGRSWQVFPERNDAVLTAFCAFSDMHPNGVAFRHIPRAVLNAEGHKRGKGWDQFKQEYAGEVWQTYDGDDEGWYRLLSMRRALRRHADAHRCVFEGGKREQSLVGRCVTTGLEVRIRPDIIKVEDNVVLVPDLKSARDVKNWDRDVVSHYLHVQAAMTIGMLQHVFLKPIEFVFVTVDKTAPFCVETKELEPEFLECGADEYVKTARRFAECLRSGVWLPENHGQRKTVHTPQYLMTKWADGGMG